MREIRIPAFAKVNLRLDILGKRPDNYHELRTIFQTISLHDELKLRASKTSSICLTIQGNESLSLEPVRKNLVWWMHCGGSSTFAPASKLNSAKKFPPGAASAAVPAMPLRPCSGICGSFAAPFLPRG